MEHKKSIPALLGFAILTVITTFAWIGFEVYRTLTKEPSPSVPEAIIRELDPNLDTRSLANITQGVHLSEEEIGDTELVNPVITNTNINVENETVAPSEEVATSEASVVNTETTTEATAESTINQ